jgi:hypothetical protein
MNPRVPADLRRPDARIRNHLFTKSAAGSADPPAAAEAAVPAGTARYPRKAVFKGASCGIS